MRRTAIPAIRSSPGTAALFRRLGPHWLRLAAADRLRQWSPTSSLVSFTRPVRTRLPSGADFPHPQPPTAPEPPMTSVLCVGIAVLDYVYAVETMPARPEKYRARDLAVVGGGIAANAAVAVARLGGGAMLATRLGDDPTGDAIVADLEGEGVDCSPSRRFEGRRSPTSAIFVDPQGERLVMSYADPDLPADPTWLPTRLPDDLGAMLGDTRWPEGAAHLFG